MPDAERIPTNLRTLLILEILGKSDGAMTATEINENLGLPKQTVHRLCTTLEKNGFIVRQGNSRRFLPARRLRDLGAGILHNSRLHIARRQILRELAQEVGETVNFVVPEDDGMSYVDRVETDWVIRIQLPIGTHVPFHCTASGKCFMASLAPKARKRFVDALKLKPLTPKTHTDQAALLTDLSAIADRGYSLDDQEFIDGMVAIAVPVRDPEGRFMAALACHGPTQRISIQDAVARKDVLQNAARRLSETILVAE
ncbi:IclR family transcriptional regulator [Ovoidimarina sediminis]|uniref:IclR family transcriptional regulator n=1 Tax=Ovoidimarina sediminis TaxID=3079856 RepID=UPI00290C99C8|nr:IclR family transcriptional regulator [Rhodophyticola sp. MJ-SS7]MDU8945271.1 IclR family transcriptional regulator [Rhodophyticola sp. MJ-SS7]